MSAADDDAVRQLAPSQEPLSVTTSGAGTPGVGLPLVPLSAVSLVIGVVKPTPCIMGAVTATTNQIV